MKKIISFFVLFLSLFVVYGQQPWTLDSCVSYALENNYSVRTKLIEIEGKKIALTSTKMGMLPEIGLQVGQDFDFGRAASASAVIIDNTQSTTTFGIGLSMPLFQGLRSYHQLASDKLSITAATQQLNQVKENIALQITSYYLQILLCKEMLSAAQLQVDITDDLVKKTTFMVDNGKSSEADLYNAKATLANDRLTVINYSNQLRLARLDLAQLMNVDDPQSFTIADPDTGSTTLASALNAPLDLYSIIDNSIQNRADIKAEETIIDKMKHDVKVAQSGYYPSLSLSASYGTGYYYSYNNALTDLNVPFGTQFNNNSREIVGVSLSFPIFDKLTTYHGVQQAKLQLKAQNLALQETKRNVIKEVEQAYSEALSAKEKYYAAKSSATAARIAFDYESIRYASGASTPFQFNEAKLKYYYALSTEIQSKYDFLLHCEILKYYGWNHH